MQKTMPNSAPNKSTASITHLQLDITNPTIPQCLMWHNHSATLLYFSSCCPCLYFQLFSVPTSFLRFYFHTSKYSWGILSDLNARLQTHVSLHLLGILTKQHEVSQTQSEADQTLCQSLKYSSPVICFAEWSEHPPWGEGWTPRTLLLIWLSVSEHCLPKVPSITHLSLAKLSMTYATGVFPHQQLSHGIIEKQWWA